MAKPDGRVEAGQSLKRAISAQRWNDLCDAADIVHGRRGGIKADPAKFKGLPCQIGTFGTPTTFGAAYHVTWSATVADDGAIPSKVYPTLTPVSVEEAFTAGQSGEKIVIGHPSGTHNAVYSGFAAALVQVGSYSHKYARAPIGSSGSTIIPATNFVSGRLQSAHYGPIQIVDYFELESSNISGLTLAPDPSTTLVYPNFELAWALVWL